MRLNQADGVRRRRARPRPAPRGRPAELGNQSRRRNSITSISSLFGTSANTRARVACRDCAGCCAAGAARRAARWPARTAVDCAATASSTRVRQQQQLRVAQRDHGGAARFLRAASRPRRPARRARFRRSKRALPAVRLTPSRPLASRYTPSGVEPDSNSRSPAGREKCTAPAASASSVPRRHVLEVGTMLSRQSMARRNSCAALDCSSSSAMGELAAATLAFL